MKWIFLLPIFLTVAHAEVSKDQVDQMLKQMVKNRVISQEDADKARVRIYKMKSNEWGHLNKTASHNVGRGPASVSAEKNMDLDQAQFHQIKQDMQKIWPK